MDNYGQNYCNHDDYDSNLEEPLTTGQWLLTLLILAIPCVNLIMLFVWGFSFGNESRKNFCRAYLIFYLITMVLSFLLVTSIMPAVWVGLSGMIV